MKEPARRERLAIGTASCFAVTLWLVALHRLQGVHEVDEPGLLVHWLRDAILALPLVLGAVWLAAGLADRMLAGTDASARLGASVRAALLALAATGALALGSPVHAWLFGAAEDDGTPLPLHLMRDATLGLPVALAVAAAGLALLERRRAAAASPARVPAPALARPTRRGFLTIGAGGIAAVAVGAATVRRTTAQAAGSRSLALFINEGEISLIDGKTAYVWGYGTEARRGSVTLPGSTFPAGARMPTERTEDGTLKADPYLERTWASVLPERVLQLNEGETLELSITNTLREPHNFVIRGVVDSGPIAPGATWTGTVPPTLQTGTYIFEDTLLGPVGRVLGLHGVVIVTPPSEPWRLLPGSESLPFLEFERQFVWIFHDIDPAWNAAAKAGRAATINPRSFKPAYFTINGRSGVEAVEGVASGSDTRPCGRVRNSDRDGREVGQAIRLVNTGLAAHQIHFHGNHVIVVTRNGRELRLPGEVLSPEDIQSEKDVVRLMPLDRKDTILPMHTPHDALGDRVAAGQTLHYPMHCHAEMSQTAAGGMYPGGQVTDWVLLT
jgi:hypothetical protein